MSDNDVDRSVRLRSRSAWICLAGAALFATGCGKVNLYSDLPEREANVMMAALLAEGIDCAKQPGDEEQTWKLTVPADDFTHSVNLLTDIGYPTDKRATVADMFQKSGLVSSPTEDRIRYVYALSEELAETISRIDGVVDARVHVVMPNNDPFAQHVRPSSASVYIKHSDDIDMTASQAQIKDLVSKSIEGLETKNVEVFLDDVQPRQIPQLDEPHLKRVLGIKLETGSLTKFWRLVGGLGAAASVNLLLVVFFAGRQFFPRPSWFRRKDEKSSDDSSAASRSE